MANKCLECGSETIGVQRAIIVIEGTPEKAGSSRVTDICFACRKAAEAQKLGVYIQHRIFPVDNFECGAGI